jgi:hypothetical protein
MTDSRVGRNREQSVTQQPGSSSGTLTCLKERLELGMLVECHRVSSQHSEVGAWLLRPVGIKHCQTKKSWITARNRVHSGDAACARYFG